MVRARGDVEAPTELDQLWSLRPRFYELFMQEYNKALRRVDPVILELCRLRMAQVFECDAELAMRYLPAIEAGLTEEKIVQLASYPTSPEFTERERACIGFAEQFAIQSSAITHEDCAALQQHISPHEFVYLAKALGEMDQMQRLWVAMDVRAGPAVPTQLEGFVSLVTSRERS
jgi:alkylhydroperoxidase family enzyme